MAKWLSVERSASKSFFGLLVGFALTAAGLSDGLAQTGSGTIRGTVKDPAGSVVANASVTLINTRTDAERKATTSPEGLYVFSSIPPGAYAVRIEASGFKITVKTGVVISPAETRGLDVTLEIGATSET